MLLKTITEIRTEAKKKKFFFLNIPQERCCNGQITLHIEHIQWNGGSIKKIYICKSKQTYAESFFFYKQAVCLFLFNKNKYSKSKYTLNNGSDCFTNYKRCSLLNGKCSFQLKDLIWNMSNWIWKTGNCFFFQYVGQQDTCLSCWFGKT